MQGEYLLPPDTRIPNSAASMAQLPPAASPMDLMGPRAEPPPQAPKSGFEQEVGRWRLQVSELVLLHACAHCAIWKSAVLLTLQPWQGAVYRLSQATWTSPTDFACRFNIAVTCACLHLAAICDTRSALHVTRATFWILASQRCNWRLAMHLSAHEAHHF